MRRTLTVEPLEHRLAPAVTTWDGGGADARWTSVANWIGDAAPQPGDDLVFPLTAARLTSINDFPAGTAFGSIVLHGPSYRVSGNAVPTASRPTCRTARRRTRTRKSR